MKKIDRRIDCLVSTSRGCIAGCSGPSIINFELIKDENEKNDDTIEKINEYQIGVPGDIITSLAIKPSVEDMVVCTMASK